MPQYLNTDELAEMVHATPATVRYWRHTGYGPPYFRAGRRVLYNATEVEEWLQRLETDGAVEILDKRVTSLEQSL